MDTDQADSTAPQAHASGGQPPPVGGAGGKGGGGGQEEDAEMAGADDRPFKRQWRLPGEIPHLARLLEAAGLTQSAHNGWLPRDGEPLTRASTAPDDGNKRQRRRRNNGEYLAMELLSPTEAAAHKAAWPKGQEPWMAADPGEKTLLTIELFTEEMVYLLKLGHGSLAGLYPHQRELDRARSDRSWLVAELQRLEGGEGGGKEG